VEPLNNIFMIWCVDCAAPVIIFENVEDYLESGALKRANLWDWAVSTHTVGDFEGHRIFCGTLRDPELR
jgi:hypothetical protein